MLWVIQAFRTNDLAVLFPDAVNGDDMSSAWDWAANFGVNEHTNILGEHAALYDVMWVYEAFRQNDLGLIYPEANNAGGLVGLYDWAANFGVNEHADILSEHASEYAAGPP